MAAQTMKRTRLMIVSGPLARGGAERCVSNLLVFLDRKKFELCLCLCDDCIEYPLPNDVRLVILDHDRPWYAPRTIRRLAQAIREIKPDVILSNIALTNRLTGIALRQFSVKPRWVARIGNNPFMGGRGKLRHTINTFWERIAYPMADHFIVNSQGLAAALPLVHSFSAGKISVVYNPVDFPTIAAKSRETPGHIKEEGTALLIHAGRFHRQKRHDVLLEAMVLLQGQLSTPCHLWLCGDGYLRSDSVTLLGHCQNPFALFRQADVFLLTSDWEGMPNALIEAMSLALPAVATDCRYGPNEIIVDGKTGFLAHPDNPADIAEKTRLLLETPEKAAIGRAGSERVQKMFAAEPIIDQWQELLR